MEYAIVAALERRPHRTSRRFATALRERSELTVRAAERDRRHCRSCRRRRRSTRCRRWRCRRATTDADYVLALLRATGVLCVYGSGFGTKPEDGFFRVVFLASPAELVGDLRSDRRSSPADFLCARLLTVALRPLARRTADLAHREDGSDPDRYKPLILWTIAMTALAVILLWAAFLVRDVLLLLYISGLLAIGFSPIVRLIERQQVLPIGSRRFPRWLAILVLYLAILGAFALVGVAGVPAARRPGAAALGRRRTRCSRRRSSS